MDIGMMWLDNSKRSLSIRIDLAAQYYLEKYGEFPTFCFVNPDMMQNDDESLERSSDGKALTNRGVRVMTSKSILPNHFWIGA